MFSPQNHQMKICVLKSNLEEIEKELVVQNSTLPALDADNEEKYRETMGFVQEIRSINAEIELKKEESARLTAKRRQLQQSCEEMTKLINKALDGRNENENQQQQVEGEIEQKIRKYEAFLREMAERFRKMHNVYNEAEMKKQLEMINENIIKITTEEGKLQNAVKELQKELESIVPDVSESILAVLGKKELENKLKEMTDKCKDIQETRDRLQKKEIWFRF